MQHDEARLKSLARQYNWLRQRGESHAEALNNLQQISGEAYQPVLNRLATTQQSATSDPFIANQLGGLSAVLDRTKADTSRRSALLLGALVLGDQPKEIGSHIREKIITRYSYMILLMVTGSPKSPIGWSCGYREPPPGMTGIGANQSTALRSMVPLECH